VEALAGDKLKDVVDGDRGGSFDDSNKDGSRQRCSDCSLTGEQCRNRFMCPGSGVPFCSIGSGKKGKDCIAMAHDNEQLWELCMLSYERKQTHAREKKKMITVP
jgi:hypothetical protein